MLDSELGGKSGAGTHLSLMHWMVLYQVAEFFIFVVSIMIL